MIYIIYQDTRSYSKSNLPIKVFLMIILKKWSLPNYAYRISHQKLLSQISSVTPEVCPHQISLQHLIHHPSAQAVAHNLREIKLLLKKVQFFMGDNNTQKMMTSNETRLAVAITNIIISEGFYFNLDQNLGSRRCLIFQCMCQKVINLRI